MMSLKRNDVIIEGKNLNNTIKKSGLLVGYMKLKLGV